MKKAILFLFLFHFLVVSSVFAQSPEITNGLNYLNSTQNPDGSWGSETTDTEFLPSSVSVIETLQILNQTGASNYSNALTWLQSQGLEIADHLSGRIHALSVAGSDDDLLLSYLDELMLAWGGYDDFDVNNLDTALALQALTKINYSDQDIISSALFYLTDTQNTDGGWGFYPSTCAGCDNDDDSNVYMTALVLQTFNVLSSTFDVQESTGNAVAYLLTKQNPDGGFGSSPSTVYETALAFEALTASGTDMSAVAPVQSIAKRR